MEQVEIIKMLEESTRLRGWISNSYAQVEFLLGDLIMRSRQFPEYVDQTTVFTHSAPKRAAKVRAMLNVEGALSPYASEISEVLEAFDANHHIRNLLAHGFCSFHHTPSGDAALVFRKFQRGDVQGGQAPDVLVQHTFRLVDMAYYKEQFVSQATRALQVFSKIHFEQGWGDLDPEATDSPWEQAQD